MNKEDEKTIINALLMYKSYMKGLSTTNHTAGNIEYSQYCTIEMHKAEELLKELVGATE